MGITTLVLLVSSLSFLLDRLLQYENVDEDSSGEQGHEKLVEDMLLALQQVSPGPPFRPWGPGQPSCWPSSSAVLSLKYY